MRFFTREARRGVRRVSRSAHILNGSEIARKNLEALSKEIALIHKKGEALCLGAVQVGDSKDTLLYARALEMLLAKLSINFSYHTLAHSITEKELFRQIMKLNADPEISGVMVFSPLPPHINSVSILNALDLLKDVEGRRILHGMGDRVISPTAISVLTLLEETGVDIAGKEAVVVGHSDVVGKPIAILLMDKMATVTVCHAKTKNLKEHVEKADILVAAAGKPHLIKGDWVKPGAIVIDVGENFVNGKLVGDVEFDAAKEKASFISPVPGGVGPVTNIMLVKNLVTLWKLKETCNGNS